MLADIDGTDGTCWRWRSLCRHSTLQEHMLLLPILSTIQYYCMVKMVKLFMWAIQLDGYNIARNGSLVLMEIFDFATLYTTIFHEQSRLGGTIEVLTLQHNDTLCQYYVDGFVHQLWHMTGFLLFWVNRDVGQEMFTFSGTPDFTPFGEGSSWFHSFIIYALYITEYVSFRTIFMD